MVATQSSPFGSLLRTWRKTRKRSQLDLALEAEISARHLSFVETGRSKPSRDTVLLLAEVLEVPLRDRNALLTAAGFAPLYRRTDLDAPEMASVKASIEFILEHHNPFPAILFDRHWNIMIMNRAAMVLLPHFVADPAAMAPPVNVLRVMFDNRGMRPFITNWEELAGSSIQRLHREAQLAGPDDPAHDLLAELLARDDVPESWRTPRLLDNLGVIEALEVERDGLRASLFSTITTLGTPVDITLQDLRIETFFPADEASRQTILELVEGSAN